MNTSMDNMFDDDKSLLNRTPIKGWHITNDGTVNPIPRQKTTINHSTNSNKSSGSVKPNSKASASSNKASSVIPSSTNSSKTSSSVAPSSTSSKIPNKASSNANNSASVNSQSNSQSSSASQNNSSSIASSSTQPSDNTNNMSFVPSFNIPPVPSTPVVTPTRNNTTLISDNNNNNYSSVVPSVKPQTANTTVTTDTDSQVSNSTKPTINKHHNSRIARNHHVKRRSIYLFNTNFKGLSKRNRSVVTIKGIRAYKYVRTYKRTRRGHYTRTGHYVALKYIRPNTKLSVRCVVKFGRITKLQLTNGWLITSNKHYVAVNKSAKHINKRTSKRIIKGINAFRYTRALRKSNYVLRHDHRRATRYVYRVAKKFARANNFEKKAYRKFVRKHTNRNRKACNRAITNLNKLVNTLLK